MAAHRRRGLLRGPGALGYPMRAIRTNRHLYIRNLAPERWPSGDPAEELYDAAADPDQLHNVAAEKRYAATRLELSRRLEAHFRQTRDPRAVGGGEQFDRYPFWGPSGR